MSLFDKFLHLQPLTYNLTNEYSSKVKIDPKKHVLYEGELNIKSKGGFKSQYYKIIDRKLICSLNKESKPLFYYDLMHFLKIEHDSTKNWFYLEKFNKRHEFYCKNVENIRKFINILKLYCVSSNFLNNYKILDTLGKGHFSQVYKVVHLESKQFLASKHMKLQNLKEDYQSYIFKEISILRSLPKNSHIIKLYEVYEDQADINLVFEYMDGGDLYKLIKGPFIPENEICMLFCQILKGLVFLHTNGIVHRDIKPDNILLTRSQKNEVKLKIADFSLAEYYHSNRMKVICGTPGYIAPEVFTEEEYDEKVDIFSLGVILYLMFTKKSPFRGKSSKEVLSKNKLGDIFFKKKDWAEISHSGKKLVVMLVSKFPGQRISLQNIFLQKWVRKNYYQRVQSKTAHLGGFDSKTEKARTSMEINGNKYPFELERSQSEILDGENDYHVPSEKSKEDQTYKTKYEFVSKESKFTLTEPKYSLSTSQGIFSKEMSSSFEPLKTNPPSRNTNESYNQMKLKSVNSLFICSKSSLTSEIFNLKSKSSISEEIFSLKHNTSISKRENLEIASQNSSITPFEKNYKNEYTLFKTNTNIFDIPIRENTIEEYTNKTCQTMEYEESPIKDLMADLLAESKPKRPSKDF